MMEENGPGVPTDAVEEQGRPKRERKQVEVLTVAAPAPREIPVAAGTGEMLGNIAYVTTMLQGFREDDETMKHLHFLLYNTTGKQGSRKRTIRNFSGYATEAQSKDALRRLVENKKRWTLAVLKDICGVLGLEKNGTREEVAKRVADFCSSPHTTKSASSSIKYSKKRKGSTNGAKAKKSKRPAGAYSLFCKANHSTVKTANPEASFADISRILSAMWAAVDEQEKKNWKAKAMLSEVLPEDGPEEEEDDEAEEHAQDEEEA